MLTPTHYMQSVSATIRAAALQSIRTGKPVALRGIDHEAAIDAVACYEDATHAYANGKKGEELRVLGRLHGRCFGLILR